MGGAGSKSKGPAPVPARDDRDDQAEDDDQDVYDEESVESMQAGITSPRRNQGSQQLPPGSMRIDHSQQQRECPA